MATKIGICNSALLMANADVISSFSDETREARLCAQLYDTTRDSLLMASKWSFSLFQQALTKTTNTPLFDFSNEFKLPTGFLRAVKIDSSGQEYRILKDKLLTDADPVELLFQKHPGEEFLSPQFVRTLEFKFASVLALALMQDEQMASLFDTQYRRALIEARGVDSQNSPNPAIRDSELALTAVRGNDG